jgi:hypothetical protein
MQAIQTKYLSPTNSRGARIKAWCAVGNKTISYPYGLNIDLAHYDAAQQRLVMLGWTGPGYGVLEQGQLPNGDYCHVMANPKANPAF